MKIGQTWEYKNQLITITNIGDDYIEYMDMTGEELWVNTFNITKDNPMRLYVAKGQIWRLDLSSLGTRNTIVIYEVLYELEYVEYLRETTTVETITLPLLQRIGARIE